MSKKKIGQIIAIILIAIGVMVSIYLSWQRVEIERSGKNTALLLDFNQLQKACAVENITLAEALSNFAPYANGVVIKEPTLNDLADSNKMTIKSGVDLLTCSDEYLNALDLSRSAVNSRYQYLFFTDKEDMTRVQKHIRAKVPGAAAVIIGKNANILATSLPKSIYGSIGMGFSDKDLKTIEASGLETVAQIRDNYYPYNIKAIDAEIDDLKGHDILALGFNDTSVAGANLPITEWSELKKHWLESIKGLGVPLVTIEFYDQKGLSSLTMEMDQQVLRLHAIGEQEMLTTLTQEKALERLQLAAAERNMKLLLVRFLPYGDIEQNVNYFINICKVLWQKDIVVANPEAPEQLIPNAILLFLIALAVLAGLWLLAISFRIPLWLSSLCFILGALFAGGLLWTGHIVLMQKGFALFSVMTFPTLAVINTVTEKPLNIGKAILKLLMASAYSLIGAVLMVGLLADGSFMLKLNAFSGVKAAHMMPIILLLIWFLFLKEKEIKARSELAGIMDTPLTLKYLLIALFIGGLLFVYIMRTGNESVSVSDWERTLRAFLDNLLVVRPRTKEFLLGYPLLLFSLYYGYSKKMLPVLLLGSIGLVSSVNTFAHIHTPLIISVFRTVNGLILGIITGSILILISITFSKWWRKAQDRK